MPVGETGPESQDLWRLTTGLTREESHWGTEGREFKSPQPDKQIPCLSRRFAVSDHRGGLARTPGNLN